MYKLIIIILSIVFLILPQPLFSQTDFSLSFNVTYEFDENGNADVTKRITLTNQNTNTYPSLYLVDVPDDASDVVAANKQGRLETKLIQEAGRKLARITLGEHDAIGVNEQTNINLSYDTRSLAQKDSDEAWQISIPPISTSEEISAYNISVVTPEAWGAPTYTSPPSQTPGVWTMNEQGDDPIIMRFDQNAKQQTPTVENEQNLLSPLMIITGVMAGILVTSVLYVVFYKRKSTDK